MKFRSHRLPLPKTPGRTPIRWRSDRNSVNKILQWTTGWKLQTSACMLKYLRHVMKAMLSVRPKCSRRCFSPKEFPWEPVLILKHATRISTEQTSMRMKWLNISRSKLFRSISWIGGGEFRKIDSVMFDRNITRVNSQTSNLVMISVTIVFAF